MAKAYAQGSEALKNVRFASIESIILGVTRFRHGNYSESLIMLWTFFEQIISQIWVDHILPADNGIIGRMDQLKDNRTWTIATRCELLFRLRMISELLFSDIYLVRKARNILVHDGTRPDINICEKMLGIILKLVSLINTSMKDEDKYIQIVPSNIVYGSSCYSVLRYDSIEVKESIAWRRLLPLPGDKEWGDREFFDVMDTHLVPVKHKGNN